jgi:hypothetical protein
MPTLRLLLSHIRTDQPPRLAALGALFLLLSVPAFAKANIGREWWGNPGTEPHGGLKEIAIRRETLQLDLRPLAELQPAFIEAAYEVYNPGPGKDLDLIFVAGSDEVSDFEVFLGYQPLASSLMDESEVKRRWNEMPATWKPPKEVPSIQGYSTVPWYHYPGDGLTLLSFHLHLPSGSSTLRARYRAKAAGTYEGYPTTTWQLVYILAPARQWKSFGRLEVTVHLPENWEHASSLVLEREGDELRGSFEMIPADSLVISTRARVGQWFHWQVALVVGFYVLIVLGGGGLCWIAGHWSGRLFNRYRSTAERRSFLLDLIMVLSAGFIGILWGTLTFVALFVSFDQHTRLPGLQISPYYGNDYMMLFLWNFIVALVTIVGGTLLSSRAMDRSCPARPTRRSQGNPMS